MKDLKFKTCSNCEEMLPIKDFYYHRPRKTYMSTCKKCNDSRTIDFLLDLKVNNPIEFQLRSRASELTRRSKLKNIPYEKKMYASLKKQYEEQNGLCYYTNLPLDATGYQMNNQYCFVVDRIEPDKGYVLGNMVFCCNAINKIKSSFSIEELKWWVSKLKC